MNTNYEADTQVWRRLQLKRSKLKTSAKTSALLSGFAMVAMVEVQFANEPENPIPANLLIVFGLCTVLLVSVHMLALMISICILPSIEAICLTSEMGRVDPRDSPHEKMGTFIEIAWMFSNVFGLFLFLIEVAILCWVKFWEMGQPNGEPGKRAALASTIILIPVLIIFVVFAAHFYRILTRYNYERSAIQVRELENMALELDKGSVQDLPTINRVPYTIQHI
ncbi:calcium release-activated calcium channel protein 1 [Tetranychus urticae]|nr:calcium release-activated calcium channel protein 1 [Tetranychus urticae]XP_015791125.1 calcium release-activated calcium channel protein 1 [Tetranychus urticae]